MIVNFLQKNKKIIGLLFILLVFVVIPINFQTANAEDSVGCPILPDALCDPIGVVAAALLKIPMALASWILWFSGLMLNTVLEYTVTNMSSNIDGITGITIAWATIRDLANMSFLFVLLYIAISTILGRSGSQWKSTLVSIVIAAILINFSLFFTKVIIDASNVITLGFYKQIVPNASVYTGLSDSIMQPLGLTGLWNPQTGDATKLAEMTGSLAKIAILSIGSSVFMGITAFVFMAAAIMFLVRYVTIIFLLILSPIALMGSVLPRLKEHASKWWKSLLGQAIFAPLFMIMVWVVLTIIGSGGFACLASNGAPTASLADNFNEITSNTPISPNNCPTPISLAMNFIIINALIIGTLVIAKQASEQAGSSAQKIVGGALGLATGGLGWTGRKFIGAAGRSTADNEKLKEIAANVGGKYSRLNQIRARTSLKAGQAIASSTFDFRESKFAGMGKSLGMGDLGIEGKAGGKGGYDAIVKKEAENKKKFGESLKPSDITILKAEQELRKAKEDGDVEQIINAQKRVDRLKGVDKKELEKRQGELDKEMKVEISKIDEEAVKAADAFADNLEKEVQKIEQELRNITDPTKKADKSREFVNAQTKLQEAKKQSVELRTDYETKVKTIEDKFEKRKSATEIQDGAAKVRSGLYAQTISEPGRVSTDRVGFIGPVKRSSLQAASDLRKGGKKAEDLIKEALKKTGELKEDEDKEGEDKTKSGKPESSTTTT